MCFKFTMHAFARNIVCCHGNLYIWRDLHLPAGCCRDMNAVLCMVDTLHKVGSLHMCH